MMRRRAETMMLVDMGKQLASQTSETKFTQRKSRKWNQNRSAENYTKLTKRAGNARPKERAGKRASLLKLWKAKHCI